MRKLLLVAAFALTASSAQAQVSFQPQVRGFSCLRPATRAMISHLTSRIGPIEITSTCGGRHAHNSQHYRGLAIDFRPLAVAPSRAVAALHGMPEIGGVGAYANGLVHADVGARQVSWFGGRTRRYAHSRHPQSRYGYRYASFR
ncbi:MAG: DUF882 domain-containing protein [Verrucomicrobiaceae bacterium]|nr:MAG: DUF882 domain-containing protein [Verrucomicrobiaceae bacterium]